MPPFQYEGYRSPYVQSISSLLEAPGQIEAQRALQSGNAWANAAQTAGQAVGQIPQQMNAAKMQALQMQDIAAQVAERKALAADRQQKQADLERLDKAYAQPGGRQAILDALPGHLKPTVQAQFDSSDKAHADAMKAQEDADRLATEAFADTAANVQAHGYDPHAAQLAISDLKVKYANNPSRLQMLQQAEASLRENPSPDTVKGIVDPLIQASPKRVELQQTAAAHAETLRHNQTQEDISKLTQGRESASAAETARHNSALEALQKSNQARESAAQQETARHNRAQEALEAQKVSTAAIHDPKYQDKLEQQARGVLQREMSSRSGTLGTEDAKVAAANHLLTIFHQAYDPNTGEYKINKINSSELSLGLAKLMAPNGNVGIELKKDLDQATLSGDFRNIVTYLGGTPVTNNTQDVFQAFKDSIERQGTVAAQNRDIAIKRLEGILPTQLEPERRDKLTREKMAPLRQSRVIRDKQTGDRKLQVSLDGGVTWQ